MQKRNRTHTLALGLAGARTPGRVTTPARTPGGGHGREG